MAEADNSFEYDLFISFRHVDGRRSARQIRRWLKAWQPPLQLGSHGELRIFVDSFQGRPTSDYWENVIKPALQHSRWMLVVVTGSVFETLENGNPNWVIKEIETFLNTPQRKNLIPVLAKGHASKSLPDVILQRYPRIQIFDLAVQDPLAPRVPFLENSNVFTFLAIGAAIRGIDGRGLEQLRQEERRRLYSRIVSAAALSAAVVTVMVGLAVIAINNGIDAIRNTAQTALRTAAQESVTRPDRAALLAANALRTVSEPAVLNWFLGEEKRWSRELLGTIQLPASTVRVPGGRIDEIVVTDSGSLVIVSTEDGLLAAYRAPSWMEAWKITLPAEFEPLDLHVARDHVFLSDRASGHILGFDLAGNMVADVSLPKTWSDSSLTLTPTGFVLRWNAETRELSWIDPLEAQGTGALWSITEFMGPEGVVHAPKFNALVIATSTDQVGVYAEHLLDARNGQKRGEPVLTGNLGSTPNVAPDLGYGLRLTGPGHVSRYSLKDGAVLQPLSISAISLHPPGLGSLSAATVGWEDGRVVVFDAGTGRRLREPIGPLELFSDPVFDKSGARMALLGEGAVHIVDGNPDGATITLYAPGSVSAGVFLEDETQFALADFDGRVSVWDLRTTRPVLTGIFHDEGSVSLATAADGTLVSAGWDGAVRFTKTSNTMTPLWEVPTASPVLDIDLDQDTDRLAYVGQDKVGLCTITVVTCEEHPVESAISITFFDDGQAVLIELADNAGAMVLRPGAEPQRISEGPAAGALFDDLVVGLSADGLLQYYHGTDPPRPCSRHYNLTGLLQIEASTDGSMFLLLRQTKDGVSAMAVSGEDCSAFWHGQDGWVQFGFSHLHTLSMNEASGTAFLSGEGGGVLLSLDDGSVIQSIEDRHVYNDVDWSSDGKTLFLAAMSREVSARDTASGFRTFETQAFTSIPWAIDISFGGARLAVAGFADRHQRYPLRILDARQGDTLTIIAHPKEILDVLFSADGKVITAGVDGVIRAWPTDPDQRLVDDILRDVSRRTASRIERSGVISSSPTDYAPPSSDE